MLTVTMAITLLVVIMACWARVPVVAGLRRVLIDGPAAWLNGLTRRHVIFYALLLLVVLTCGEVLAALGPLDMSLVLLWDVSALVDAVVTVAVLATSARIGSGWQTIARWRPFCTARRAPRARRRPRSPLASNDDDGERRRALAA